MDFLRKTRAQRSRIHEEEAEAYYNFFLLLLIGPQLAFRQFVTDVYPGSWVQTVFFLLLDFLKVVRLVFWSGVVGPGTSFRSLAHAPRSLSRYALKSSTCEQVYPVVCGEN